LYGEERLLIANTLHLTVRIYDMADLLDLAWVDKLVVVARSLSDCLVMVFTILLFSEKYHR
jgi:hypothetical protein